MGWRLLLSLGSKPVFFTVGVTAATSKSVGTIPVVSEELIADMTGEQRGGAGFEQRTRGHPQSREKTKEPVGALRVLRHWGIMDLKEKL